MNPVKHTTSWLGMTVIISLAVGQTVYDAIFHPVRSLQVVAGKRGWY